MICSVSIHVIFFTQILKSYLIFCDIFSHLLVNRDSKIKVFEGAENNLPDQAAMDTALAIQRLAASLTEKDLLLVLISGKNHYFAHQNMWHLVFVSPAKHSGT